ncbi:tyrosine-type recombinase/integrase [Sphingorhabdus sp. SMR4y]|uniref:tyrosine-type recombinase/integrase n=1 Tax=Sphingorhabdus sp. SMR4y TaxID=2584094 RepID=UPI000B613F79|nr:site-specific integrase [Sphingorhabdus sp. SMR4y]ASK88509.1 site-specific tyrosine recombinase XerC [Sphingorhabdus sp. SMR4y]
MNTDRFQYIWKALKPHFGYKIGSAVTRADCRAYYRARKLTGVSDSTVRTELALLRACLGFKYGKGKTTIWMPPAAPPRVKWLTKDQVRAILAACETPHISLFITLAVSTGARSGAICDLTWDRVDFDNGTISFIPPGRVKTNKGRVEVPMNANARAALEEAYKGRLTDYVIEFRGKPVRSPKKALEKLSRQTGVHFSAHVFRHTCAVWMAQEDVPMQKISQYLGHTKTAVTEAVYARYSPSFMKDASAAVTW